MSRPDRGSTVAIAIAEGARWLLAAIGTAMGAPAPACTSRTEALDLATAALCDGGRQEWIFADAALVDRSWMCVVQDTDAVHLIEVSVHSGAARLLTSVCKAPAGGVGAPPTDCRARNVVGHCVPRVWRRGTQCGAARSIRAPDRTSRTGRAMSGSPKSNAPRPRRPGSSR